MKSLLHRYFLSLAVLLIVVVACGIGAYCIEPHHFLFHILIEVTIAAFTLVLTVIVVEDLLEYRRDRDRKEQWRMVREHTLKRLFWCVSGTIRASAGITPQGMKAFDELKSEISDYSDLTVKDLDVTARLGEKLCEVFSFEPPAVEKQQLIMWYQYSKNRFDEALHFITPRFIMFAPDHPVVSSLLKLESISLWIDGLDTALESPYSSDDARDTLHFVVMVLRCSASICRDLLPEIEANPVPID